MHAIHAAMGISVREVFQEFDKDNSNTISTSELEAAMEKMGLAAIPPTRLKAIIKEVDDNGNGELDYEEFVKVLEKAKDSASDLAKIFLRKQKSGPPLTWSTDKLGNGLEISSDGACLVRGPSTEGHAVAMLSEFHSIAADEFDQASVIIQCEGIAPEGFVGVIGRNFLSAGSYEAPLGPDKNSSVVHFDSGVLYHKDHAPQGLSLGSMPPDVRLHFDVDARNQKMTIEVIGRNGEIARTLLLEWLFPAFAICVGLGPGDLQKVHIVGSSTEKTKTNTKARSSDLWDEHNKATLPSKSNDMGLLAAAMSA